MIELTEGININKTSEAKKFDICHYWYFLDISAIGVITY